MTKNTGKRTRAITALLGSKTTQEAADLAGVTERTLYRWLSEPDFRANLTAAEGMAIEGAGRQLLAGQQKALDTLQDLMTNATSESVKRQACNDWLSMIFKYRELAALENRVTELERAYRESLK